MPRYIVLILLCTLFCCTSCGKEQPQRYDRVNTDIAAMVNDEFIYVDELRAEAAQYLTEDSDASAEEVYEAVLDAEIEERIQLQQAALKGLSELSAEEQQEINLSVSTEIADRYQYFYEQAAAEHPEASAEELSGYAGEAVSEYVAESGDTDERLHELYTEQMILTKLYESVTADVAVTEDELRAVYDEYVAQDRERYTAHPEYYESDKTTNAVYYNLAGYRYVKHILVSTRELAEEVLARTTAEDFEDLIAEYSEDIAAAEYIYGFAVGEDSSLYIDGFADVAMALAEPGDISDIIELEDGFHIIKYMKEIPAGAEPFADARGNIESIALSAKKSQVYAGELALWREHSEINVFQDVYESLFAGKDNG